jgi:ATP phosphoribosyltransferase
MKQDFLTIALSKGTLLKPTVKLLEQAQLPVSGLSEDSRNMVFSYEEEGIKYLMCRPTDVPTISQA